MVTRSPTCCALAVACLLSGSVACASTTDGPKPATEHTKTAQARVSADLPFADRQSFEDARRGFIAPLRNDGVVKNAQGRVLWDPGAYAFLKATEAPDTVNPSLWRQSQLVMEGGLFKVTDGLYQIRNADLSNMTIVEGHSGIIVIDPLVSVETAGAALELYYTHRPRKPVVAVIYSHSHVDHYGGVRGVINEADVRSGKVRIIAPAGFLEEAASENVMAGTAMGRRATYMYGSLLPPSPVGHVGSGLGLKASGGTVTLIPPTELVEHSGQKLEIDGLTFAFMLAPDTEAPAEMHWYIEELKAVSAAENCCQTLHNIYTPRGAKTRDPLAWAKCLDQTLRLWGDKADVMYGMHHWPVWGRERIAAMLESGRDGYRYINDQTLHLANKGFTMTEIAEMLRFPPEIERQWSMRGYYGSLNNNAKGTYIKYLGWFDANPAHLNALPPEEAAKKYVEYMGGADEVLRKARAAFEQGEYRWVAEVVNHVVFADPSNPEARCLAADALEQLGYQTENGPWRNFYLTGALELRRGVTPGPAKTVSVDTVRAMGTDLLLDYMGVRLNAERARGKQCTLRLVLLDENTRYGLWLRNSVLNHRTGDTPSSPDAIVILNRSVLAELVLGTSSLKDARADGRVRLEGDEAAATELFSLLDDFPFWFPIVTP